MSSSGSGSYFYECTDDEFECYDGKCIYGSWECDGYNDCSNWEDEMYCDGIEIGCYFQHSNLAQE